MILNNDTFRRVAKAVGYPKAQYNGAMQDPNQSGKHLVKFLVYDGSANWPTRGKFVWVNENFEIVSQEDHKYSQVIDDGPMEHVVTPH